MHIAFVALIVFAWLAIVAGARLGWQLLRQNGRLLLRLDELEKQFDELEFGGGDEPNERPDESQGRARHSVRAESESRKNGAQGTDAPYPPDHANRFGNRSLAHSKIKRDGLKTGTAAPNFRLPRLDGRGELALEELRGRRVLLVFSDPHCGPCNALAPELEKFHRKHDGTIRTTLTPGRTGGSLSPTLSPSDGERGIAVVMISKGEPKENRAKVKEHGLTFAVVLQQQCEMSRRYAMFATPIAYLIDEAGVIGHDVAVGTDAIRNLMNWVVRRHEEVEMPASA